MKIPMYVFKEYRPEPFPVRIPIKDMAASYSSNMIDSHKDLGLDMAAVCVSLVSE